MSDNLTCDRYVVFDLETTGTDIEECRIVTAHAGLIDEHGNLIGSKNWLVNPGIEIPDEATEVHGITTEYAQEHGKDPVVAIRELTELLAGRIAKGTPVIAYNIPYDLSLVDRESRRHLNEPFTAAGDIIAIDPLVIDKAIDKFRKGSRKLVDTAAYYGVELVGAHDAEADATATGGVALKVLEKTAVEYPEIGIRELHQMQVVWAAEQAASFQNYIRTNPRAKNYNPDAVIDGSWPYRAFVEAPADQPAS